MIFPHKFCIIQNGKRLTYLRQQKSTCLRKIRSNLKHFFGWCSKEKLSWRIEIDYSCKLFLIDVKNYSRQKIVLRYASKMRRFFYKIVQTSNRAVAYWKLQTDRPNISVFDHSEAFRTHSNKVLIILYIQPQPNFCILCSSSVCHMFVAFCMQTKETNFQEKFPRWVKVNVVSKQKYFIKKACVVQKHTIKQDYA